MCFSTQDFSWLLSQHRLNTMSPVSVPPLKNSCWAFWEKITIINVCVGVCLSMYSSYWREAKNKTTKWFQGETVWKNTQSYHSPVLNYSSNDRFWQNNCAALKGLFMATCLFCKVEIVWTIWSRDVVTLMPFFSPQVNTPISSNWFVTIDTWDPLIQQNNKWVKMCFFKTDFLW